MQAMHVGDRFSDTGNDSATRDCCSILWVANPEETGGRGGWGGERTRAHRTRSCRVCFPLHCIGAHWVAGGVPPPLPSDFFIKLLLGDIQELKRLPGYIE